jgi:hypothetical protein
MSVFNQVASKNQGKCSWNLPGRPKGSKDSQPRMRSVLQVQPQHCQDIHERSNLGLCQGKRVENKPRMQETPPSKSSSSSPSNLRACCDALSHPGFHDSATLLGRAQPLLPSPTNLLFPQQQSTQPAELGVNAIAAVTTAIFEPEALFSADDDPFHDDWAFW